MKATSAPRVSSCRAAAAERLEHPDAAGRLLDERGQVALLVLGAPGQHLVRALEPGAHHDHRREQAAGEQPEPPVQPDQQDHHGGERDDVDDEVDQAEPGEPADRRQVGGRARQQLARLPGVVEPRMQPLHVRVQIGPHGLLDACDRGALHPAPDHHAAGLGNAERERGQAQRDEQGAPVVADRPVDHRLDEQRDGELGRDRDQGRDEHGDQLPGVRPQVRGDPPEGRDRAPRRRRGLIAGGFRGHPTDANQGPPECHPDFPPPARPRR
jgi:hypothetical protein